MMYRFMESTLARRVAWLTMWAIAFGIIGPVGPAAQAQEVGRRAYLVPFSGDPGVDAELPVRIGNATADLLQRVSGDTRAKQPMAILPVVPGPTGQATLSPSNPIVRRGLAEGAITDADVAAPPTAEAAAIDLARRLGLDYVVTGKVESYREAPATVGDGTTAELSYLVRLVQVLPAGAYGQPKIIPISAVSKYTAYTEKDKIILRDTVTDRVSREIVSQLVELPEIAPEPQKEPTQPGQKKKNNTALYAGLAVLGVLAIVGIALAAGGGGNDKGGTSNLRVTGVGAVSEQDAVRVTWNQTAGAVGYNVYRRQIGSQPIITRRSPGKQTSAGFTLLTNPQTNSVPTVIGGDRTSFIDTTATSSVLYEYGVAAVDAAGRVGPMATASTGGSTGSNIGAAPVLSATAGNAYVSLSWTPSSTFVTGYTVYRRQGGTPNTTSATDRIGTVTGTSFDDTNVANGVSYSYVVQPYTGLANSTKLAGDDSNVVTISPNATAQPQQVRNVVATADTLGVVTVSWQSNAEPVASYEIMRKTVRAARGQTASGRTPWLRNMPADVAARMQSSQRSDPRASRQVDLTGFAVVGTATATQSSFSEGPLPNAVYQYAVRAVSTTGVRGPAGLSNELMVSAPPSPPANVAASAADGRVTLTWQASAGSVSSYRIYRSNMPITAAMTGPATATGIVRVAEVTSNVRSYTDTTVANNVTYYYALTAVGPTGGESLFGKGSATDTGVMATPHAAPTVLTIATDKQILSANGMDTAAITAKVTDATNVVVPGVQVIMTTDRGKFTAPLPAGAVFVDSRQQQVRAQTDTSGEVVLNLVSEVITTVNQQVVANVQARAAELPINAQTASTSVSMQASVPTALLLQPALISLTADQASTQTVVARVTDQLNQAVPDGAFSVSFQLSADNGEIRRSGDIQTYPFQRYPTIISAPVVGGLATIIYRAGKTKGTLQLNATVNRFPAVSSSAAIQLQAGLPTQISFSSNGTTVNQFTMLAGSTSAVQVDVRDAQGNRVAAGVNVTFDAQPAGVITVPTGGVTDSNGQITLNLTAGTAVGDAVITAQAGTQATGQLIVHVQ